MLNTLYTNYFGKDKPLRHPAQHLIVAVVGFVITKLIFDLPVSLTTILLFILFTYIPDLDGVSALFLGRKNVPEADKIIDELKNFKLKNAATHAAMYHKKFNKLLIHNIFGLFLIIIFYLIFGINRNYIFLSIFGAILAHFIFDIWDDIYQLRHIKNWLWPYFAIFRSED